MLRPNLRQIYYHTVVNKQHTRNHCYVAVSFKPGSKHYDPKNHVSVIKKRCIEQQTNMQANRMTHHQPGKKTASNDVIETVPVSETSLDGKISPKGPQNISIIDSEYTPDDIKNSKPRPEFDAQLKKGTDTSKALNNIFGFTEQE